MSRPNTAYAKAKKRLKAKLLRVRAHLRHCDNPVMNKDDDGNPTDVLHVGVCPTMMADELLAKQAKLEHQLHDLIVASGNPTPRSAG